MERNIIKSLFISCLAFLLFVSPVSANGSPVINEALVQPSGSNKEWVEFYGNGIDLTNYWLDDDSDFTSDSGSSTKKQITTTVQGSDTSHIVYELPSAIFNNDNDTIVLYSPDGQIVDQYHYSSGPGEDMTLGRTPDGTGGFANLSFPTRGSANAGVKPPDTPTPHPTSKPTKEPSPTKIPLSSSESFTNDEAEITPTSTTGSRTPNRASNGALPTAILGASTKAEAKKTPTKSEVMVKGASTNNVPFMAISFGGLFLLACGILIYLKKRRIWN